MSEIFKKYDQNKLSLTLVEPLFIKHLAAVMQYGANKYGKDNYKLCKDTDRYKDAAFRHLLDYFDGYMLDEESGLPHLAHAATNLLFLIHFEKEKGNL